MLSILFENFFLHTYTRYAFNVSWFTVYYIFYVICLWLIHENTVNKHTEIHIPSIQRICNNVRKYIYRVLTEPMVSIHIRLR